MKKFQLNTLFVMLAVTACASEGVPSVPAPGGAHNVAQGGAQDFGLFRELIERGEVPAPETLDEVGFFAEHALDLPPPDCGGRICVHSNLAVAPRFDGSNWTMGYLAMNTPIKPSATARPPLHLVAAIEVSEHTYLQGDAIRFGLEALLGELQPDDRVSVFVFDRDQQVLLRGVSPDGLSLQSELPSDRKWRSSARRVALYDAIALAGELSRAQPDFAGLHRLVLFTSGHADAGISDPARIVALAEAEIEGGLSMSVIGVGRDYDQRVPLAVGNLGGGTYAYPTTPEEMRTVLVAEGSTTRIPLASRFVLEVKPAPGYRIGRVHGAARAEVRDGVAQVRIPALYVGQRTGAQDVEQGRRGGGGGIFFELWADANAKVPAGSPAFDLKWRYASTATAAETRDAAQVVNALPPGVNPDTMWPSFADPTRGKPFMMLNMYLAFRAAVDFYYAGDCARAIGVIDMMGRSVDGWQGRYNDPDIDDDHELMLDLRENLVAKCRAATPIPPRGFQGGCMFI